MTINHLRPGSVDRDSQPGGRPQTQARSTVPDRPSGDDVVSLALGHDGVWKATAPHPSNDPATHTSQPRIPPWHLRLPQRQPPALALYSAAGILHIFDLFRGQVVDLYA